MEYLWKDRKRHLGLPLSFTRYALSEDRLFLSVGFFSIKDEEILLYRIRDISTSRSLWQRIFGVGTAPLTDKPGHDEHLRRQPRLPKAPPASEKREESSGCEGAAPPAGGRSENPAAYPGGRDYDGCPGGSPRGIGCPMA